MKICLFAILALIGVGAATVLYGADSGLSLSVSRPSAPVLVAPEGSMLDTSPTFSWNASATANWYYLWVSGPAGKVFSRWYTEAQLGCVGGSGTCSVEPVLMLNHSLFSWWVRPWNSAGEGPWSERLDFSVGAGAPGAATLISPAGEVTTNNPTYTWNAVADSSWYYLWVNDASGTPIRQWYTSVQVNCAGGSGTCSISPDISVSGGSTWWVRTWNEQGTGPWSNGQSFTAADPGASLLFHSGFENGVYIDSNIDPLALDYRFVRGTDEATGYRLATTGFLPGRFTA
jgi:hypothetical protein